jgi:hypothetical protein
MILENRYRSKMRSLCATAILVLAHAGLTATSEEARTKKPLAFQTLVDQDTAISLATSESRLILEVYIQYGSSQSELRYSDVEVRGFTDENAEVNITKAVPHAPAYSGSAARLAIYFVHSRLK